MEAIGASCSLARLCPASLASCRFPNGEWWLHGSCCFSSLGQYLLVCPFLSHSQQTGVGRPPLPFLSGFRGVRFSTPSSFRASTSCRTTSPFVGAPVAWRTSGGCSSSRVSLTTPVFCLLARRQESSSRAIRKASFKVDGLCCRMRSRMSSSGSASVNWSLASTSTIDSDASG